MSVIGIICEYNPFHNGHLYHLQKIKELYPDSLIILVLNGYFSQRGEISIISKQDKTKIALEFGIDLVIELPFVFGTQSADVFADISIKLLELLKCDYVIFGSESNDLDRLNEIVLYTLKNEKEYNEKVKDYLDKGLNYPTSLAKALNIDFEFKPNDLLGISYIKSIKKNNCHIKPLTIKRTNDYLDTFSNEKIISAANIREKLLNNKEISRYVPSFTLPFIHSIRLDNLFYILKYKIITEKKLEKYLDVDEGIENRLKKIIYKTQNIDDLINQIKTKRYTYNRIKRMLIHILIGLTKEDNQKIVLDYIKILGFNKKGKLYLNKVKKDLNIALKPQKSSLIYQYELVAASVYDFINGTKELDFEISNKPIRKI